MSLELLWSRYRRAWPDGRHAHRAKSAIAIPGA